jgi:NADH-quinone oxidoreductase subunit N
MNTIDLMTPLGVTMALLPELILVITALIVLLVAGWRHSSAQDSRLAGWISLAGVILSALAVAYLWGNNYAPAGIPHMIALDPFRYAALAIFLLSTGVTVALSLGYMEREGLIAPEYYALILLATIGMMVLGGATDFITLFLGLEVMSVSAYALVAFDRSSSASAEAGLKYFLIGAFASAFLLYGIALVYGPTGSTNILVVGAQLAGKPLGAMGSLGLGMLLIGFAFKVSAVPFHMWAPDVYDGAPTPITGYMATGVKAAAIIALIRVLMVAFPGFESVWQPVIFALAVLTMLVGNLVALTQPSIKRMMAYSSIAHAGYLLVGVWSGTRLGAAAVLIYLLSYGITTLAVFGLLSMLGRGGERDVTLDELAGLARERPWMAFALAVCMLSLLGFPGTFGFIGKWMILSSVILDGQWVLAVILVIASVVSAGYYLPVVMSLYMRDPEPDVDRSQVKVWGVAAGVITLAIVAILALGIWPPEMIDLAMETARALMQQSVPIAAH